MKDIKNYKLQIKNSNSGFTLIEIILVLAITAVGFTAIYALYASNIKHEVESRYEIIASNLAQEGVEIIRNRRDEEIMLGHDMNDRWSPPVNCRPYWRTPQNYGECSSGGTRHENVQLLAGGTYRNCFNSTCNPGGGAASMTPFRRSCDINALAGPMGTDEAFVVTCTVDWDSFVNPSIIRSIEATSVMTDWNAN
ncbi:MAG: prepilin-type N-terminal cleavage/methylation domain-containing protein [Patescibacteria group bacterium]|nr:prepilin-type N-terminal cleavage/methylation domain-containing protein [Patescibacteria group bacterium]